MKKNKSAKLDAKNIYNNRWKNSLSSGEYNILHDGKPDTQVKYFYDLYCHFILNQIKNVYPDRDLSKLSIPKIQQEYLKVINNEDFQEISYLDNNDIIREY